MGNAIDGTAGGALNDLPGSNNLGFGAPMAASPAPGTLGTLVIPGGTQPAVTDNSQPLPAIINSQGATQQAAPDQPISLLP
jgi:hypothetical protein